MIQLGMPRSGRAQSLRVLLTPGNAPRLECLPRQGCEVERNFLAGILPVIIWMWDIEQSRQRTIPRNRHALVLEGMIGRGERI